MLNMCWGHDCNSVTCCTCAGAMIAIVSHAVHVASFPGPAHSSLAVRNSLRGPGLVHHVMSATVVFLRHQITMFAVLPIYMYNGISS